MKDSKERLNELKASGYSVAEAARVLNREGYRTVTGLRMTTSNAANVLAGVARATLPTAPRATEKETGQEISASGQTLDQSFERDFQILRTVLTSTLAPIQKREIAQYTIERMI